MSIATSDAPPSRIGKFAGGSMAKLTTKARKALPAADFAIPGKRAYPLNDASHARNALARASNKSPAIKAKVRAAVKRKFPKINQAGKGLINSQ
jgi:hypothetical protein